MTDPVTDTAKEGIEAGKNAGKSALGWAFRQVKPWGDGKLFRNIALTTVLAGVGCTAGAMAPVAAAATAGAAGTTGVGTALTAGTLTTTATAAAAAPAEAVVASAAAESATTLWPAIGQTVSGYFEYAWEGVTTIYEGIKSFLGGVNWEGLGNSLSPQPT